MTKKYIEEFREKFPHYYTSDGFQKVEAKYIAPSDVDSWLTSTLEKVDKEAEQRGREKAVDYIEQNSLPTVQGMQQVPFDVLEAACNPKNHE